MACVVQGHKAAPTQEGAKSGQAWGVGKSFAPTSTMHHPAQLSWNRVQGSYLILVRTTNTHCATIACCSGENSANVAQSAQ